MRRAENSSRNRYLDINHPKDGSGVAYLEGVLYAHDGELIDARLDAMAATVCDEDPRTFEQRRADAMSAVFDGATALGCACGSSQCPAAGSTAAGVVVHVVAGQDTLTDPTPAELDGATPTQSVETGDPTLGGPAATGPGYVLNNGAVLPAPIVAAKLADARRRPVVHPGDAPPEQRRTPSAGLAWFVRCRDLTCRFPGCAKPATSCDLDHSIPYPRGATQATNLKCLCRAHHLVKTFWGWRDVQRRDGTVEWTSPDGQTYTTQPGSRLLFPTLCRPTAPAVVDDTVEPLEEPARCLKMPRRKRTRAQAREHAITDERRRNQPLIDERNEPPPF